VTAALEVQGLGKRYGARAPRWALRDVSFDVAEGSSLGLVGANGAGKSTLLKLLARTSSPTTGRFRIQGPVASLLELGGGFHPDFTGRENALMNGVLLGRSRREMRDALPRILEFAELEEFADEPVRTYSTGMAMRLGFATALEVDPRVLLLDEVFAVGDMHFQKRCVDRLFAFKRAGGTLVLCSHSLYDVRQMCRAAVWLRAGRVAALGRSEEVTSAYAAWQAEREDVPQRAIDAQRPHFVDVQLESADPEHTRSEGELCVHSGSALDVRLRWRNSGAEPVHVGVTLTRHDQTLIAGFGTHLRSGTEPLELGERCTLRLPKLSLLAGRFTLSVYLFDENGVHRHDEWTLPERLVVRSTSKEVGLVRLEHAWELPTAAGQAEEKVA